MAHCQEAGRRFLRNVKRNRVGGAAEVGHRPRAQFRHGVKCLVRLPRLEAADGGGQRWPVSQSGACQPGCMCYDPAHGQSRRPSPMPVENGEAWTRDRKPRGRSGRRGASGFAANGGGTLASPASRGPLPGRHQRGRSACARLHPPASGRQRGGRGVRFVQKGFWWRRWGLSFSLHEATNAPHWAYRHEHDSDARGTCTVATVRL